MAISRGVEVLDVLAQLEKVPLFDGLDREQILAIKDRSIIRKYRAGEIIIEENEPCIGLFIILSGSAKIFKMSCDGREQVLYFIGTGETFGEVPIFDDGFNPITLLAMEDSYAMIIEKEDFKRIIASYPQLAQHTFINLSNRVRKLFSLVEDLSFNDVGKRLARMIFEVATEKGVEKTGGITFELNMTHQEIAAVIGTVREMVSRTFKKFEREKIIKVNGHEIVLLDRERLRELT